MANDFSNENIYSYFLLYKCSMAEIGAQVARTMAYKELCTEDKIKFILAFVYLKMMCLRNSNECITDEMICNISNYIKQYIGTNHSSTSNCGCS